jgi:hypothetical protein
MSEEQNGHGLSRLDRIERAIGSLIDEFRNEHKDLRTSQILLTDTMGKLAGTVDKLTGEFGTRA